MPSVCKYVSLAPDVFYSYPVFKSVTILRHCTVTLNVLALSMGALVDNPTTQNGDSHENV
jgi:hypothetical protein